VSVAIKLYSRKFCGVGGLTETTTKTTTVTKNKKLAMVANHAKAFRIIGADERT
jgi:hypothetical protein